MRESKQHYITNLTMLFGLLYFFIIPQRYSPLCFGVLFFALFSLLKWNKASLILNRNKLNKYVSAMALFAFYLINLLPAKYGFEHILTMWAGLFFCILFLNDEKYIMPKTLMEILIWFLVISVVLFEFAYGEKAYTGEVIFSGAFQDKNYTGIIVFLFFLMAEKRKVVLGKILILINLLFFSKSRSFLLLLIIYYSVVLLKLILNRLKLKRIKKEITTVDRKFNIIFFFFVLSTIAIICFSYYWVNYYSVGELQLYRTGLNDSSNRMRFSANIFAWEEQLTKFNYQILFQGLDDGIKLAMGIPNNENVIYYGVRLVVSHNSVIHTLLTLGWIPGILYLLVFSKYISARLNWDNIEYILPYLINSIIINSFEPALFILWSLAVTLPSSSKKYIRVKSLSS